MTLSVALRQLVRERAGDRCEYCLSAQHLLIQTYHLSIFLLSPTLRYLSKFSDRQSI